MRRSAALALLCLSALLGALPGAARAADVPRERALYHDGPGGRHLLEGEWLFRADPGDGGMRARWPRAASRRGWTPVRVPHAWNAGDDSEGSMLGSVGWYRKDFRLPSARVSLRWAARFESVNHRSQVWLNGRPVGSSRGAYLPFEVALDGVRRRGVNRLVVRVDSRRGPTDLPPAGLTEQGTPSGGWWNYGGLLREVYLRRLDTVDWRDVLVRPALRRGGARADVRVRATLRNVAGSARRVRVTARFGSRRLRLGSKVVPAGGVAAFARTLRLPRPRLWSPADPHLYDVALSARAGGREVAGYVLRSGIRTVERTADGRLLLNGQTVRLRGVGLHEDSRGAGFAVDNAFRRRLVAETQALGATLMRTHYPMHPYVHELADRKGILIWSEIPVYGVKTEHLKNPAVRRLALDELARNIATNGHHPSVLLWSIANELSSKPGPVQTRYIRDAAALARRLDPTRPVGLAVAGYPGAGCQPAYAPLDVVGINEYFGWYPGPNGSLFDRTRLPAYLDQVRACYPDKAVMVTEFGAEANRDGPPEEKGTWAFQREFVDYHLGAFAAKPWLSGAIYWALNEFRVRPAWEGGNPRPAPPIHQKGLLLYDSWARKPAWEDVRRWFTATPQYGG